jgi:hypothetical protein
VRTRGHWDKRHREVQLQARADEPAALPDEGQAQDSDEDLPARIKVVRPHGSKSGSTLDGKPEKAVAQQNAERPVSNTCLCTLHCTALLDCLNQPCCSRWPRSLRNATRRSLLLQAVAFLQDHFREQPDAIRAVQRKCFDRYTCDQRFCVSTGGELYRRVTEDSELKVLCAPIAKTNLKGWALYPSRGRQGSHVFRAKGVLQCRPGSRLQPGAHVSQVAK